MPDGLEDVLEQQLAALRCAVTEKHEGALQAFKEELQQLSSDNERLRLRLQGRAVQTDPGAIAACESFTSGAHVVTDKCQLTGLPQTPPCLSHVLFDEPPEPPSPQPQDHWPPDKNAPELQKLPELLQMQRLLEPQRVSEKELLQKPQQQLLRAVIQLQEKSVEQKGRRSRIRFNPHVEVVPIPEVLPDKIRVVWKWPTESDPDDHDEGFHDSQHSHTQSAQTPTHTTYSALDKLCKRFVFHPTTWRRVVWDVVAMLLIAVEVVVFPLSAFDSVLSDMDSAGFVSFDWFSACFWLVDIPSQFFAGYNTSEAKVEMRFSRTSKKYLKSWFLIDVIIVTFDFIALKGYYDSSLAGALRISKGARGLRILRALRLLRAVKLMSLLQYASDGVHSELGLVVFKILKLLASVCLASHFLGCGWYWVGSTDSSGRNWVTNASLEDAPSAYQYAISLHWSLSHFTPATTEIVPMSARERFYSIGVLLTGMIGFCACISTVTSALGRLYSYESSRLQDDHRLRMFLGENTISSAMSHRVWEYIRTKRRQHTRLHENEVSLLSELPRSLRNEMRREMCIPTLQHHPFFAGLERTDPHIVHRLCDSKGINFLPMPASEDVFIRGEKACCMYIVASGSFEYHLTRPISRRSLAGTGSSVMLHGGDWLSEGALWFESWVRFGWLRSAAAGDLLSVDAATFRRFALMSPSPYSGTMIYRVAWMARIKEDVRRSEDGVVRLFANRPSDLTGDKYVIEQLAREGFPELLPRIKLSTSNLSLLSGVSWH
eukprot:TRINITY_DN27079_c0_g1_i1.p1 TRINITY_DN27079_c0_g1~~TRINITY_DN27079_c0_g1_i1.p1  ORF type:complete len:785 (+),score=126.74 TRINITY_DN27079_c0_g1_i1:38-2356(+)